MPQFAKYNMLSFHKTLPNLLPRSAIHSVQTFAKHWLIKTQYISVSYTIYRSVRYYKFHSCRWFNKPKFIEFLSISVQICGMLPSELFLRFSSFQHFWNCWRISMSVSNWVSKVGSSIIKNIAFVESLPSVPAGIKVNLPLSVTLARGRKMVQ